MLLNRPDFNDIDFHYAIRNKISDAQKRSRKLNECKNQIDVLTTLSESSSSSSSSSSDVSQPKKTNHSDNAISQVYSSQVYSSQVNSSDYSYDRSSNQLFAPYQYQKSYHHLQPSSSSSSQFQPQTFSQSYSQHTNIFPRYDSFTNQ
jgi:hypothetical protein